MPTVSDAGPFIKEVPQPAAVPRPQSAAGRTGPFVQDTPQGKRWVIPQPDGTNHVISPEYLNSSQGVAEPNWTDSLRDGAVGLVEQGGPGSNNYIGKDIFGNAHAPIGVKGKFGITYVDPYAVNESVANRRRFASALTSFVPGLGQVVNSANVSHELVHGSPVQAALSGLGAIAAPWTISGKYGVSASTGMPSILFGKNVPAAVARRSISGGGVPGVVPGISNLRNSLGNPITTMDALGRNFQIARTAIGNGNPLRWMGRVAPTQTVINALGGMGLTLARAGVSKTLGRLPFGLGRAATYATTNIPAKLFGIHGAKAGLLANSIPQLAGGYAMLGSKYNLPGADLVTDVISNPYLNYLSGSRQGSAVFSAAAANSGYVPGTGAFNFAQPLAGEQPPLPNLQDAGQYANSPVHRLSTMNPQLLDRIAYGDPRLLEHINRSIKGRTQYAREREFEQTEIGKIVAQIRQLRGE